MGAKQENVKWVDGLRGFASLLVVFTHIARAFDEDLFKPVPTEGSGPRILQLPLLRVLIQGRIGVSIFSLVTGYVCALKPIRLSRAGTPDAAFTTIAKSAFRRVPRLVLPTTIATAIIWFFCQFGVFEVGNHILGWWVNFTSPNMTPYFGDALQSLFYNILTTWTRSWNEYDMNQWTLLPLLKGSMLVYTMLIATVHAKPKYRMMIELGLFVYYYVSNDSQFGMQFFFGAFLSDLSQHEAHIAWCQARKWPSRILSPIFIIFGLLLASYPEDHQEWMTWSQLMKDWSVWFFPENSQVPQFYSGVGLEFIALGIHFSPSVKGILSHKHLLWFGKNSFAVYLLHGGLLRSILTWMFYGFTTPADVIFEDGHIEPGPPLNICGRARFWFWLPIWFIILYSLANLWTRYVDPWCARVTETLVKYVFDPPEVNLNTEKPASQPLLPQ
ncbi:hypothetical protein G7Y89_g273 [Cudoniella acicularis]|uniref:Acyltransferase 3 domain-containing protein n=1 Tax=Cudoniella acicularis TaxID=354080 RepID=A0A8H4W8G0_9HELO|nr:hypothetical protein G7Y89_g273 [Cudoniella acicularis]